MDLRRLKLLPLARYKLKYLGHIALARRDLRAARSFFWATLFSRDAGLALQDFLYRYFPALGPYPKQMEIEVTTACNLKCTICEHTYWKEHPRHMRFEQFQQIMDQFPNLRWVGVTGIGSGFLNPRYLDMLRYLKEVKHCYVEFFDPFLLLDEGISRELIRIGIDKIWISMEAARKETYEAIRVGSSFERVTANLRALVRAKREVRSPLPELWFHFIITQQNQAEMEEYVELVADLVEEDEGRSAPIIYWTNLLPFPEVYDLVHRADAARMERIERMCQERGIFSVFNENLTCDKPMRTCTKWNEPFVLVSGHIQPCCALNEANDRPYQEQHAFMNLFDADFRLWWRSPEKRRFLRNLKGGEVNPVCKNCHIFRHPESAENVSIREFERRRAAPPPAQSGDETDASPARGPR